MEPLRELPEARQIDGEPARRWFSSPELDLIVWIEDDAPVGFQLCYDKHIREHALTWREGRGFDHSFVDDGESHPASFKSTPILRADGHFDAKRVSKLFKAAATDLPPELRTYVADALEHYPGRADMSWQTNLIEDSAGIRDVLADTRTIAVLGIKTEAQSNQPAFYVASYMANAGYEVIPVPVYFPEVKQILGKHVYRKLADIPGDVDMVNVFRRPDDIPQHVDDILAKKPKAVWLQLGIRNDKVAEQLAKAGIKVVQNRCLMVDHRGLVR